MVGTVAVIDAADGANAAAVGAELRSLLARDATETQRHHHRRQLTRSAHQMLLLLPLSGILGFCRDMIQLGSRKTHSE